MLRNKPKTIEIRKKRDFLLDCNSQNVKLPHYNALHDKNLSSFLQNFVIKQHLLKMKLVLKFLKKHKDDFFFQDE